MPAGLAHPAGSPLDLPPSGGQCLATATVTTIPDALVGVARRRLKADGDRGSALLSCQLLTINEGNERRGMATAWRQVQAPCRRRGPAVAHHQPSQPQDGNRRRSSTSYRLGNAVAILNVGGGSVDQVLGPILRYWLYDLERIVSRTLVYGLLMLLLSWLGRVVLRFGQLPGAGLQPGGGLWRPWRWPRYSSRPAAAFSQLPVLLLRRPLWARVGRGAMKPCSAPGGPVQRDGNAMVAVNGQDGGASGYSPAPTPYGVWGDSATGFGVVGASSTHAAVYGRSRGALNPENLTIAPAGVLGEADRYIGVYGRGLQFGGVFGEGEPWGVSGYSRFGTGIWGTSETGGDGVHGDTQQGRGVVGTSRDSFALYGSSTNSIGLFVSAPALAALLSGALLCSGWIIGAAKSFRIDHPSDPAGKYLNHASVESSELKTFYDGKVELDAAGRATVQLPSWFEALNGEVRYQLTAVGAPAPDLHIATELADGRFEIAGGPPGCTVCWQVTAVRRDRWSGANPLTVEQDKVGDEQGQYLHPDLYDQPPERGIAAQLSAAQHATRDQMEKQSPPRPPWP